MKVFLVFWCVIVTCVACVKADGQNITDKQRVELSIECENIHYVGFPMFVNIKVTNANTQIASLPEWDILDAYPPITLTIYDEKEKSFSTKLHKLAFIRGEVETERGPRPILKKMWTLDSKKSRNKIVNIAPLLESLKLPTGKYKMQLFLWDKINSMVGYTPQISIEIVKSNDKDIELLGRSLPDFDPLHYNIPNLKIEVGQISTEMSNGAYKQASFLYLLSEVYSAKNIVDLKLDKYKQFSPSFLLPEIDVFKYEILIADNDKDKAKQIKENILKKYPELEWQLKEVENGNGYIAKIKAVNK